MNASIEDQIIASHLVENKRLNDEVERLRALLEDLADDENGVSLHRRGQIRAALRQKEG